MILMDKEEALQIAQDAEQYPPQQSEGVWGYDVLETGDTFKICDKLKVDSSLVHYG